MIMIVWASILGIVIPLQLHASGPQVFARCSLSVDRDGVMVADGHVERVLTLAVLPLGEGGNFSAQVTDAAWKAQITADFYLDYHQGQLRLYHGKFKIHDQLTGQQFSTYLEALENGRPLFLQFRGQLWRQSALVDYAARVLCEISN